MNARALISLGIMALGFGVLISGALHPQTLLCDTMNWQPLTREHGAPLRL
jgi:DMSO/TMAO reductase YedYZ molybdopterin-dependent catalytic subunit